VGNEFVQTQPEYLLVVFPDGANEAHAGLSDVYAVIELYFVFDVVWAFRVNNVVYYA